MADFWLFFSYEFLCVKNYFVFFLIVNQFDLIKHCKNNEDSM